MEQQVILIGGPEAGKTNFLARAWIKLGQKDGLLAADKLPDDCEYIQTAANELLKGKFAAHTPTGVYHLSTIPIYCSHDQGAKGNLLIPDRYGEQWKSIHETRQWPHDFDRLIGPSCGALLFFRICGPDHQPIMDPIRQSKFFGITKDVPIKSKTAAATPKASSTKQSVGAKQPTEEKEEIKLPTEVLFVDWLQCLRQAYSDLVNRAFIPRVGIIISAWDLLGSDADKTNPDDYLTSNFNMLEQFIESTNGTDFEFALFGASVAGGDLSDSSDYRKTYMKSDPTHAGYVIHSLAGAWERTDDVTIPLAWAMGVGPYER